MIWSGLSNRPPAESGYPDARARRRVMHALSCELTNAQQMTYHHRHADQRIRATEGREPTNEELETFNKRAAWWNEYAAELHTILRRVEGPT